MTRRIIIALLAVLVAGAIGGGILYGLNKLRSSITESPKEQAGVLPEAETGGQRIVDPTADQDNDGLNNADEKLWGTSPDKSDTDQDGVSDKEEISAGRNPTIPGPNDVLPQGFKPGADEGSLTEAERADIPFDQLFTENLDVTGGSKNLTEAYRSEVPKSVRTSETVVAFVNKQPIITQLPTPAEKAVALEKKDSATNIAAYLNTAGNTAALSNRALLANALTDLFENKDAQGIYSIALSVEAYQQSVVEHTVPPSAEKLHRILLGYTELLSATLRQIAAYNEDPMKSLVGIRQLEEIDKKYYPIILGEISRLREVQSKLK